MLNFTRADVLAMAGASAFNRGQTYQRQQRVSALDVLNHAIYAEVRGSSWRYYESCVELQHGKLSGYCSCPVGYRCKHVVAVALQWLSEVNAQPAWLDWLQQLPADSDTQPLHAPETGRFHLLYTLEPSRAGLRVEFIRAYLRKDGNWGQQQAYQPSPPFERMFLPEFITPTDLEILNGLTRQNGIHSFFIGASGHKALQLAAKTGRLYYRNTPISLVKGRRLEWQWHAVEGGKKLQANLEDTAHWLLIHTQPLMFFDRSSACIGELLSDLDAKQILHLQKAPTIPDEGLAQVSAALISRFNNQQLPAPLQLDCEEITECTPHARITSIQALAEHALPCIELQFDYGPYSLPADYQDNSPQRVTRQTDERLTIIQRDLACEQAALETLHSLQLGLDSIDETHFYWLPQSDSLSQYFSAWQQLTTEQLPRLAEQGWRISQDDGFQFNPRQASFSFSLSDNGPGWFDFGLQLTMDDGSKLDNTQLITQWLEQGAPEQMVLHNQGNWLQIDTRPLQQIHSLLRGLVLEHDLNHVLQLPLYQAAQLEDLPDLDQRNAPLTRQLIEQLNNYRGIEPIPAPALLQAQLRDYQQQGLNWLAFLYRNHLGGILADDMGLGKTLQVLAFIAWLKAQNHSHLPVLVVAPTSLLGNWQREAARFAPHLTTCILHGSDRHSLMARQQGTDIIITSYALLHLDIDYHSTQAYALAVLDEAQAIKNPQTKTAISARRLKAGMRLCLSGTPLENHLGELWSLMDFALPGLLYGRSFFNDVFRNPIEKDGVETARNELARKISPFILRRTKQQVAAELPEKTTITQYVELGSKQAALYEGIRLSMEKHIRDLVAKQGLAKSHIAFLDALLKLRQACIAPQLVKLEQAHSLHDSAKLDWLDDHLPAMLEEGRRILLFSQFTQALGLVEDLLRKHRIAYSKLTGATRKRQEAIDAFQNGNTLMFLISLKAGGAGLNLTAADTVIHLDPWWNPAVENQATDRAYRIGQDKPVFVYKLVASGTVEERIQLMQEHKQALADSLFGSASTATAAIEKEELLQLLAH